MNKYTSGPWTSEVTVGDRGGWATPVQSVSISAGTDLIAYYITDSSEFPDDDAENEANARLISAAPELLEALRLALKHLDTLYPTARGDDFLVDTCVAAIAKATGEAP